MKRLPLRYVPEYQARLRRWFALKERYGKAVASVFIDAVTRAENRLKDNCSIGKSEPYLLNGQMVTLNELYFSPDPRRMSVSFPFGTEEVPATRRRSHVCGIKGREAAKQARTIYRDGRDGQDKT